MDRLFSLCDLSDRSAYARFLTAQAAAHIPVERALTAAGAASIVGDWSARQRTKLLQDDLAALGLPCPDPLDVGGFQSGAAVLGAVYVLEGSRLGGRMLARSVPAAFPSSFLRTAESGGWRCLQTLLDTYLDDTAKLQAAVDAAKCVFTLFELGGKRYLLTEET